MRHSSPVLSRTHRLQAAEGFRVNSMEGPARMYRTIILVNIETPAVLQNSPLLGSPVSLQEAQLSVAERQDHALEHRRQRRDEPPDHVKDFDCFYTLGGPFCGCPRNNNKSPTIWDLCWVPLILGNSHVSHEVYFWQPPYYSYHCPKKAYLHTPD